MRIHTVALWLLASCTAWRQSRNSCDSDVGGRLGCRLANCSCFRRMHLHHLCCVSMQNALQSVGRPNTSSHTGARLCSLVHFMGRVRAMCMDTTSTTCLPCCKVVSSIQTLGRSTTQKLVQGTLRELPQQFTKLLPTGPLENRLLRQSCTEVSLLPLAIAASGPSLYEAFYST